MRNFTYRQQAQPYKKCSLLSVFSRYLFWTDWGSVHPKIERASMDGDSVSRRVILDSDIMWPTALTLDTILQRVYFADTKLEKIETCKYDGSSRIKLVTSGLLHPIGLAVFEDNLYYTDYKLDSIFRLNKLTGHNYGKMRENLDRPTGINVVHPLQQKKGMKCRDRRRPDGHDSRGVHLRIPRGILKWTPRITQVCFPIILPRSMIGKHTCVNFTNILLFGLQPSCTSWLG